MEHIIHHAATGNRRQPGEAIAIRLRFKHHLESPHEGFVAPTQEEEAGQGKEGRENLFEVVHRRLRWKI